MKLHAFVITVAALLCMLAIAAAAPAAPIALKATVKGGVVSLNWEPISGAKHYDIFRGTRSGGAYGASTSLTADTTSYLDSPPSAGTYYYVVTATDSAGTSVNSNEVGIAIIESDSSPVAVTGFADPDAETQTSSSQAVALSVPPSTDGTVSFVDNWAADPVKGGWANIQIVAPDRMRRDPNTATAHGLPTARVEVRPGDDPVNSSGERAEVANMRSADGTGNIEEVVGDTVYYAMSYLLPTDWQNPVQPGVNSWSIVLQLHGPDNLKASPAIALYANSKYQVNLNGGDLETGGVGAQRSAWSRTYDFNDGGSLNLGSWTDLVMRVTYSQTPSGRLTVWRRNEGQSTFALVVDVVNVATLQYRSSLSSSAAPHYWKQGIYRQESISLTNILWKGPLARGTSFKAVEWAAFNTTVGDPGNIPPTFSTQPQSQTIAVGRNTQFTSSAFGTAPVSYQWYLNGISLSDGVNVSGTASPALTLTNLSTSDQGTYTVIATNPAGHTSSNAAVLTVDASAPSGTIGSDPFTDGSATNVSGGDVFGFAYFPSAATAETFDDSNGIGSGNALLVSPTATSGKVFAPFEDVTLANAGAFVELQFDLRFTQQPDNGFSNFRFGLYQGFSTPPSSFAYRSDDIGYGCYTNPGGSSTTATRLWSEDAGDDALGGGGSGALVLFSPMAASANLGTTRHTARLRVTRQASGDLVITGTIDGTTVSATHDAASVLTYTFNEFGIGNGGSTSKAFAIDNLVIRTMPDTTGPSGGTIALAPTSPVHANDALAVELPGWTDSSLPLSYSVLMDGVVVSPQGSSPSRMVITPTTPGEHVLKGRTFDALNNVTEVTKSFRVNTPVESWRVGCFGSSADSGTAADDADPNGNGIQNLLEYALGGDPVNKGAELDILPKIAITATNTLQLSFPRLLDRTDLTLTVQGSDTLTGPWMDLARSVSGGAFELLTPGVTTGETGNGNLRSVTVSDLYPTTDPAHPTRFMRLRVTR